MRQEQRTIKLAAHDLLRQERQRRGWSRASIAEKIGVADPKTIGRWERGDAFPSAYFLQRLCTLFEMPAEKLGLWQRDGLPESVESAPTYFLQHSASQPPMQPCVDDPALPPAPDEDLVGRENLLLSLKTRLRGTGRTAVAALSGWPGVGKTALAIRLAHDRELREHFRDGVLWACLGPDVDLLDELRRWGRVLEIDENSLVHPESIEEWSRAIHARIGTRSLLLIIDDAWTCQDALAFKIGGPNCAYLLTTRIPAVALYFTEAGASTVEVLSTEESLHLLARFIPSIATQERAALRELAHLAGGLPLALKLMGTHLRTHLYSGQPRRWHAALERLKQPEARLQLTMPRAPLEHQMGLPADAPISLYNEIELSYQRLSPEDRLALQALASLSGKNGSFSEEAALVLRGVTLEALDNLLDTGLLASTGLGHYTLHQTVADFASFQEELAQNKGEIPPQLSVLRQLRGHGNYLAERPEHQQYLPGEVMPALAQGSGETVII
ncbi:MAG TPA: NB-ARC domain-containing protein [Ktedonobacteraceae bacterium]